jgi:hypothetical protein
MTLTAPQRLAAKAVDMIVGVTDGNLRSTSTSDVKVRRDALLALIAEIEDQYPGVIARTRELSGQGKAPKATRQVPGGPLWFRARASNMYDSAYDADDGLLRIEYRRGSGWSVRYRIDSDSDMADGWTWATARMPSGDGRGTSPMESSDRASIEDLAATYYPRLIGEARSALAGYPQGEALLASLAAQDATQG